MDLIPGRDILMRRQTGRFCGRGAARAARRESARKLESERPPRRDPLRLASHWPWVLQFCGRDRRDRKASV